jgi:hypothetical protein
MKERESESIGKRREPGRSLGSFAPIMMNRNIIVSSISAPESSPRAESSVGAAHRLVNVRKLRALTHARKVFASDRPHSIGLLNE